jgi:hypothetical protein
MSAKAIKERIGKYGVGFIEGNDTDYIITDPWIYYSVIIHAHFDTQEGIQCDGFLEDDPNLLEDNKESDNLIPLNQHVDKWLSEEKDVVSFRYNKKEGKYFVVVDYK